ncbi:hypothetical protein HON36_01005 [Candidatus Parcubacteria bacterium]|jgi:Na+/melibiose symporter-like transporter|nr:hypothetical protein [Candidatus Parcubacteria bacterium]MBT7228219.1 hypothetical protein [Candidatus Parcubacteria bacterium]
MRNLIPIILVSSASLIVQRFFFSWVEALGEQDQQRAYLGCLIGFAFGLIAGIVAGGIIGKRINWSGAAILLAALYLVIHFAIAKITAVGFIFPCFFLFMLTYFFIMWQREKAC